MSHRRLRSADTYLDHTIAVGWDDAMNTYFATAWTNSTAGTNTTALWIGPTTPPISDPAEVIDALRPYVHPTVDLDALRTQLIADRAEQA